MTLSDIRSWFVESTGRNDLWDVSDGSDNGANKYINEGSRLLDVRIGGPKQEARYIRDIYAGTFFLPFQDCRAIKEVWLTNSDGERNEIEKKDLSSIKILFDEVVEAQIKGTTIAFVDGGAGADTITDSGSGFVTAGFEAGQTINIQGSDSNDGTYTIVSVVAGTITLATGLLTTESASANITILSTSMTTGLPLYYAPDIIGLASPQSALVSSDFNSSYGHHSAYYGNHHAFNGIYFMPPANKQYSLEVLGLWYQKTLTAESDVNYWSVNFPGLLKEAAVYELEKGYRNNAGATAMINHIEVMIEGIDATMTEEDIASVNQMEG